MTWGTLYSILAVVTMIAIFGYAVGTRKPDHIDIGNIVRLILLGAMWPVVWIVFAWDHIDIILSIRLWTRKPPL